MEKTGKVLVTGAAGFIGGHLVADLVRGGHSEIRAIDCKPISDSEWYQVSPEAENICADPMQVAACRAATRGIRYVFNLAADRGGMGFMATRKAECMLSVLINTHLLMAAREASVERFFQFYEAAIEESRSSAVGSLAIQRLV
jgi:GDP-D-mannose 3',5'-epimerase